MVQVLAALVVVEQEAPEMGAGLENETLFDAGATETITQLVATKV